MSISSVWYHSTYFVSLCLSIYFSLNLFNAGFLLSRNELSRHSTCNDFDKEQILTSANFKIQSEVCWLRETYKKAVIILIDALRYDFATYNTKLKKNDVAYFQNKMPIFHELLKKKPSNAVLYKFIADAPTTTLQRLKGLTAGSLPTFIDAQDNFSGDEVLEDNLINQLVNSNKKIVGMGDDTWNYLFPKKFSRSYFYKSFNLMDLHEVDDKIMQQLPNELKHTDWDVLIAHFLGVDHCGHRYGPNTEHMAAKLSQMNTIISDVVKTIGNDTILIVMGDHGMTSTGDHGGSSTDEVNSALFMYSPKIQNRNTDNYSFNHVNQVDLVPTLSLLLGIPIPYSNLGKVVEDVFANNTERGFDIHLMSALRVNYLQVERYLESYFDISDEFPINKWNKLKDISKMLRDESNIASKREKKNLYVEYLTVAKLMCEEIWAKFDVVKMICGIFLLFQCFLMCLIAIYNSLSCQNYVAKYSYCCLILLFLTVICTISSKYIISDINIVGICLLVIPLLIYTKVNSDYDNVLVNNVNMVALLLFFIMCLLSFSNSFVVVENYIIVFMLMSLLLVKIASILTHNNRLMSSKLQLFKLWSSLRKIDLVVICCAILNFIFIRSCFIFWKCREEQSWCELTNIHTNLNALPQDMLNVRYFTSLLVLPVLVFCFNRWLTTCGNLNGTRIGVVSAGYTPYVFSILTLAHWAIQAKQTLQNESIAVLPAQLFYFILFIHVLILILFPLFIYELPLGNNLMNISSLSDQVVPQLYHNLKAKFNIKDRGNKTPVVYGLATSLSAPLLMFQMGIIHTIILIAGDGMSWAILLTIATGCTILLLHGIYSWISSTKLEELITPDWCSISLWVCLCYHGFYATGHQPTFPSIHWEAAFVGFNGNWGNSNVLPMLLVGLNTYSSHIIFGIGLPLLVLVPLSLGVVFPKLRSSKIDKEETGRGEFVLIDHPEIAYKSLAKTSVSYIVLHLIKVLCTTIAAFILRRNLFVWKIFAPHFIFEAIGLLVTCGSVMVGYLFMLRVIASLLNWSNKLQQSLS